ncbi:GNAT family N-acetyltransferase [Kribbella sp. NPDC050241]|uniref:GNAT family N-acetyltransferase n=1 Tax=Kribbella sp. NPDC050241 TaxID=3364115 RepID=UPI00379BEE35
MDWVFRKAHESDLPELVTLQERGAVEGLGHIFPQETHPFPRADILDRWAVELADPSIAVYVSCDQDDRITGFAARRDDEVFHFGTAVDTWGSGLATYLHDALLATFPSTLGTLRLRVFTENTRARRFYEKLGWHPTGRQTRTAFPPHPNLTEYILNVR